LSLRLLLVVPSLGVGGAERVMVLLARGLARADQDVTLVAIDGSGPLREELERPDADGVRPTVKFRDLGQRRARSALPAIVRTVRELRPDVLMSSQTHLTALLVLARPLLGGVRLVAREPMLWVDGPREPSAVRVLRRCTQPRTDLLLASSAAMRDELATLLRRSVEVLPNPVDVDMLRARGNTPVRHPGAGRRFLYVGRLAPGKGLEDLLEAFATGTAPNDSLAIVGSGPLRDELAQVVARLMLTERVEFLGMSPDPAPMMAGADAVVIPSRSEGMPNVALEALAVGTPVIATTDLRTLNDLADAVPSGAVRLVPRAELGGALAATEPLPAGPRTSLLPEEYRVGSVVTRLLTLLGPSGDCIGPSNPMRILFLTLAPYPSTNAASVQSANMAQAFAELGHEVLLVAANSDPSLGALADAADPDELYGFAPRYRASVLSPRERRGQSYLHALRVARLAREHRPDLVFTRNLRGCLLPALRGIPTVFEAHTLSSLTRPQDRWFLRRLLRAPGFRGIVAISAALAEDLGTAFGIGPESLFVAHDAARVDIHAAPRPPRETERKVAPHVVYTGSLFPGKGADLVVDVAARCPWARFSIAGGPPSRAALLADRIRASGVTNVTLVGELRPIDARTLQCDADILVAPFARRIESDSGHDIARWTSPLKLFEYMASERPIVASDLPVLREILRPGIDALMVAPEDLDALVAALERLRDDPGLGERLATSARERVRAEFTWEIRARRILERFCA